ncbi:MAG: hypothetical protein LBP59_10375 [Planctomycetaceae bacterium]|jgi:hypothetical protein|nr:hypothetical protein [Planctomycetaceae bacterium]
MSELDLPNPDPVLPAKQFPPYSVGFSHVSDGNAVVSGIQSWSGLANLEEVNNTLMMVKSYTIDFEVRSQYDYDDVANSAAAVDPIYGDTPRSVLEAAGLPRPLSPCPFDPECRAVKSAVKRKHSENEKGEYWVVTCEFTNKPVKLCFENSIENPLMQPPVISVTSQSYQETARFNYVTYNSLTGGYWDDAANQWVDVYTLYNYATTLRMSNGIEMTEVDKDSSKLQISISFNLPGDVDLSGFYQLLNHLNVSPMWGFPAGCVKYSGFSWSREYWGVCMSYFKVSLTFDVQLIMGYDRNGVPVYGFFKRILDHGTRYLPEGQTPSIKNLLVARTADGSGEIDICLDGQGHALAGQLSQWDTATNNFLDPADLHFHNIQPYPMANLWVLGVPAIL